MSNTIKSAYFAGGCFWGVEYYFEKLKGVESAISGYMGGHLVNPTYQDICTGSSGHLEVVQVNYNPDVVSFEELTKLFFEIHDQSQANGQGPDIGSQYLSAIFYNDEKEKESSESLISILKDKGYSVVTQLINNENIPFYEAEEYHQDYYFVHNKIPYCHSYTKKF
jgi:peptide-methionine (S)-S-oxide reductase/peptide methionine sulfoxide reductase msrA/msrB